MRDDSAPGNRLIAGLERANLYCAKSAYVGRTARLPARIPPLAITAFTATSAAGRGRQALARALATRQSGLVQNSFTRQALACWIGRVAGLEDIALPAELGDWDSRNHRLAWLALNQDGFREQALALRERYGAARVALVLGTSTSSIGETERAYRELDAQGHFSAAQRRLKVHQPHALGAFVQTALGLRGPCLTIATACSSSAKVFASAERLLRADIADAAIVGGVDSLCGSVLYGFNSLELVSPRAVPAVRRAALGACRWARPPVSRYSNAARKVEIGKITLCKNLRRA